MKKYEAPDMTVFISDFPDIICASQKENGELEEGDEIPWG